MYLIVVVLLHAPMVQQSLGSYVSQAIGHKLGTRVSVGRIDLGFFNRLIIDGIDIHDQKGDTLLAATRLSVKISPYELTRGHIVITSFQLFGMKANVYRDPCTQSYNYQFAIDSLQSKDKGPSAPLYLQANSIILRNGSISFRQQREHLHTQGHLNSRDIELSHISAHIILDVATNDSLSLKVKRMALHEVSGLQIDRLTFRLHIGRHGARLSYFGLQMPHSDIRINQLQATYAMRGKKLDTSTLRYACSIEASHLSPSDFSFLQPALRPLRSPFALHATFKGTHSSAHITDIGIQSADKAFSLRAHGGISSLQSHRAWQATVSRLSVSTAYTRHLCDLLQQPYPSFLNASQDLRLTLTGKAQGHDGTLQGQGRLASAEVGQMTFSAHKSGQHTTLSLATPHFDLRTLTGNDALGALAARLTVSGQLPHTIHALGDVQKIAYKGKTYNNIHLDASYSKNLAHGTVSVDDPIGKLLLSGQMRATGPQRQLDIDAHIADLHPASLGILRQKTHLRTSMHLKASLAAMGHGGKLSVDDVTGQLSISDLSIATGDTVYHPQDIALTSTGPRDNRRIGLSSGFCQLDIAGKFSYVALVGSLTNIVAKHIHTLPGASLHYAPSRQNDFYINANVSDTRLLDELLGVKLDIQQPMSLRGRLTDHTDFIDLHMTMPAFSYNGSPYRDAVLDINTQQDSLCAQLSLKKIMDNGTLSTYRLKANACDNSLSALLKLNEDEKTPIKGSLSARTHFYKNEKGVSAAHIEVAPSTLTVGDTIWNIHPSTIEYAKNDVLVNHFSISHANQYLTIDGRATNRDTDSLYVNLHDININYILNLVNFHSVEFSGQASGQATLAACFTPQPAAHARLVVNHFRFENGRMGTLHANASLNNELKQIDITATAVDEADRRTFINGYVSPQRSDICLDITAQRTRLEFMESFCSSFMRDVEAEASGTVRLAGPLSNINLTGQLVADGQLAISSLNTTYTLHNDSITFIPDAIIMRADTITDRNGNIGIVNGKLGHQHLTRLTYDLDISARNLLAYDTHSFDGSTFYGTAYVTGDCKISGRSGQLDITVNGTPQKGSILVYNVASPDAITSHDFIKWTHFDSNDSASATHTDGRLHASSSEPMDVSTDIRLNFLINCTPDATVKLLMDDRSGDYITLNGNGVLKANYYNKGSFDLFGNYNISSGHYRLTVQNFLKRDFLFRQGSSISFGGDPYAAALNLNAVYTLNSVSLSDLSIGKSFTSNNTRVDCLMDITGTPAAPHVDFSLDVPTLSADARQMIYSVINSEEEMNQQVLYLLAVGRFMSQGNNNAAMDNSNQQSQASLAMQSILSGTISQQVNDVIGNITNSSNWNFGANISTGTEGFNNAEYEGLLSGRLFSGRLLVDGQFGYRDNANATTSFIGDFDLKYLLYPNGNLAINFYNKTNDRYFTRNSLTTQGIGLLMKKDFTNLSDLFGWRKKARKKKEDGTRTDNATLPKARQRRER